MTARKIVLTAWKLVFVRSVSLRPSSGFLECRNLTKRKHGALLSSSSGYPCKETKYMMKHSVQRLPFFYEPRDRYRYWYHFIYRSFFLLQQLISVLTKQDMIRMLVWIISYQVQKHERRPICRGERRLAARASESVSRGQMKITSSDNNPDNA